MMNLIPAFPTNLEKVDSNPQLDQDDEVDLDIAKQLINRSYDLMWKQENFVEAVELLERALHIQRNCLGKHHNDVGWTCNFIGTGYWRMRAAKPALRYFFEARRIFAKHGNPRVKGVDNRILCILSAQMGISRDDLKKYQTALERMIEHQHEGDRLKIEGSFGKANDEDRKSNVSPAIQAPPR